MNATRRLSVFLLAGTILLFSSCAKNDIPTNTEKLPSVTPSVQITNTPTPTLVPVDTPTPVPVDTPTPSEQELLPLIAETLTPEPTAVPSPALTADNFNASDFFTDAVFSGDSVLSHFYWKVPVYDKETFGNSTFLAAVSYSAREALKPESEIHPMYKGEQQPIWESMEQLHPKRIFLFFGLNDIGVSGVNGFIKNYQTLISNIKTTAPEAALYILSITPMRADCETTSGLNNEKIAEANVLLQEYCIENSIGYIDVATMLLDETGALNTEYSDGTNVHLTKTAYLMWKDVLVNYAKEQLLLEYIKSQETEGE